MNTWIPWTNALTDRVEVKVTLVLEKQCYLRILNIKGREYYSYSGAVSVNLEKQMSRFLEKRKA